MRKYAPGTFGHVTASLGLGWSSLSRLAGVEHSTVYRWAEASQSGKAVILRGNRQRILKMFQEINRRDRERGGAGAYTVESFGFRWTTSGRNAPLETQDEMEKQVWRLNERLSSLPTELEQYQTLAAIGAVAKSELERAVWDVVWRRFCRTVYKHTPDAYKSPPRIVSWYRP